MVINPDGTGLRRLTHGIDPVLSPDGQTVAFTRWEGETGTLWLINMDGSNERSILGFIKQAKGPDWSPDGSQIVFNFQTGGRTDPKTECFGLGEGKSPPRPPGNATNIKVKFGSSGASLCWTLPPDPHWGLRVVNLADGNFKDVDGGTYAFRPAWDPGQAWRIISDGGRGLLEVDVNRDYRQGITDEINDGSPVFSPDGRYLAVTMGQQGGGPGWDIYRLNTNGTGRVRLTQTPLWETATPGNDKAWNNVAPAWSPDGSQIAFLTDRTGRWEIWVMNADGSDQHSLFSDEINNQLQITYNFVDERVLSWR
jgi:Tol biopolymer transport system component